MTNTPGGYFLKSDRSERNEVVVKQQKIDTVGTGRAEGNEAEVYKPESENSSCPACSGKHKERDEKEFRDLKNRLKRIEGQVRGVEGMLENDAYCTDILIQISAIVSALNSFNKALLANHMRTCVAENIRKGNDEVIDELVVTLQKLMK